MKRYSADPFLYMDTLLQNNMLSTFIQDIIEKHNKEMKDRALWDFYLNKVHDKSFKEFIEDVEREEAAKVEPTKNSLETIINRSLDIANSININ